MITNFLYLILAALGLGLLVFIHELAHYWMAKRVGMKVEAFSIGFGKAIIQWKRGDVQWRLGWLPFGGYVKIAGMQAEKGVEPHDIEGGYFSKSPQDRIKVAAIAPIVNLILAFLLFTAIWALGGREKPFQEYTDRVGWVDQSSEAYHKGIRTGDEITRYNSRKFRSFKDLFQSAMIGGKILNLQGYSYNYLAKTKTPFDIEVEPYQHPDFQEKGILTSGILAPSNYLIYSPNSTSSNAALTPSSPLYQKGLNAGDRFVWMDGELLFSTAQLNALLNSHYSLITFSRAGKTHLAKIPRVLVQNVQVPYDYNQELQDTRFELSTSNTLADSYTLPYQINASLVVEKPLELLNAQSRQKSLPASGALLVSDQLLPGDKILAVDGNPIQRSSELFSALQKHEYNVIVQSGNSQLPVISWQKANDQFETTIDFNALQKLSLTIGQDQAPQSLSNLKRLSALVPMTLEQLAQSSLDNPIRKGIDARQELIDSTENQEKKEAMQKQLDEMKSRLFLGISFQDRVVLYNPPPTQLFAQVTSDVWHTLKALVTGSLNPKWLSGPIGIVQVMHQGWSLGLKEALYWLALISLNLGFLNLMPIPALDGGHICFSLWEMATKKKLSSKTMERIVLPFVVLLIGLFVFVTFHDLSRLIKGIF